jgi:hypothetical protein
MGELSVEAASVAHGIHYAILGVGVVGLLALLWPQWLGDRRGASFDDEHEMRVLAVAEQISAASIGARPALPLPARRPAARAVGHVRSHYLPLAVTSSAAAAGVHAAVGPAHFRELLVFGLFFVGAALAQVAWSFAMVIRPSQTLLVVAVLGNSAVLLLWLVTRTIGLPGLMPEPEAVGLWDLSCGAWELVVILAAGRLLQDESGVDLRLPAWSDWCPFARAWALGSVLVLPLLTLIEIGA